MLEKAPVIEPLGRHHDRAAFSCGIEDLDRYLRERAGQDQRANFARDFVAVGDEPQVVAGFYTLSTFAIDAGRLHEELTGKIPRYRDVPAVLIGRLAVSNGFQGRNLGKFLLFDALKRILDLGDNIAAHMVVVHAITDAAASFYERYGFQRFPDQANHLFLVTSTIKQSDL